MKKIFYSLIVTIILTQIPGVLKAQQCEWIGGSGVWNDPLNWSCNRTPGANDSVHLSGSNVRIGINSDITIAYLYVGEVYLEGAGHVTVSGDFEVGIESLNYTEIRLKSITVKGKLRSVTPAQIYLYNTELILQQGGIVRDFKLYMDFGSLIIYEGATLEFENVGSDFLRSVLQGRATAIINNGTILCTGKNPNYAFTSFFLYASEPGFLYNTGVIKASRADLVFSGNATHKGAEVITDSINNIRFEGIGFKELHQFDSSTIITKRLQYLRIDSVNFKNSTIRITDASIDRINSFIIDSTNSLSISKELTIYYGNIMRINKDITLKSLTYYGGTLTGTGNIHVTGDMNWSRGQIGGTGSLIVDGRLNYSDYDLPLILNRRQVIMNGGGTWTNPRIKMANGASFFLPYTKTLTVNSEAGKESYITSIDSTGTYFANYGTFEKKGSNTLTVNSLFKNARILTIEEGMIDINGTFNNLGNVRGGGTLDLRDAVFTNTSTFVPHVIYKPNIFTLLGNFTNSIFFADVKSNQPAGVGHDQLVVSDSILLSGKLKIREYGTVNPGSFVIMKCKGGPNCLTGTFDVTEIPANYSISYTDSSVIATKNSGRLTQVNGGFVNGNIQGKSKFNVYQVSGNTYRIETGGQNNVINILNAEGKLQKRINTTNRFTDFSLSGFGSGVYFMQNVTQQKVQKIRVN